MQGNALQWLADISQIISLITNTMVWALSWYNQRTDLVLVKNYFDSASSTQKPSWNMLHTENRHLISDISLTTEIAGQSRHKASQHLLVASSVILTSFCHHQNPTYHHCLHYKIIMIHRHLKRISARNKCYKHKYIYCRIRILQKMSQFLKKLLWLWIIRAELTERAGMVANTSLLGDYKVHTQNPLTRPHLVRLPNPLTSGLSQWVGEPD